MEQKEALYYNVKRLVNSIERNIKRQLENSALHDLALAEISIIEAIGLKGQKSIKEIAEHLDIAISTPTKAMDRLVAKGYIIRETSPDDRRVVVSRLTDRGVDAFLQISQTRQKDIEHLLGKLSEEDIIELNKIVKHILSTE